MSYRSLVSDALSGVFESDAFGTKATYQGEAVSVIFRETADPDHYGQSKQAATGELKILRSQVPAWERGDQVVIAGVTWKVVRQLKATAVYFKLLVEHDRRVNL